MNSQTPVFYTPGKPGIIDVAIIGDDGIHRGGYSGETLEQMRLRYPGAAIGELGPVAEASDAMFVTAPTEIDEGRYTEMLEILPPKDWKCGEDSESFKMCEFTSGTITAIFCRIGNRYFEMQDSAFMKHEQIVQRVISAFPELNNGGH